MLLCVTWVFFLCFFFKFRIYCASCRFLPTAALGVGCSPCYDISVGTLPMGINKNKRHRDLQSRQIKAVASTIQLHLKVLLLFFLYCIKNEKLHHSVLNSLIIYYIYAVIQ